MNHLLTVAKSCLYIPDTDLIKTCIFSLNNYLVQNTLFADIHQPGIIVVSKEFDTKYIEAGENIHWIKLWEATGKDSHSCLSHIVLICHPNSGECEVMKPQLTFPKPVFKISRGNLSTEFSGQLYLAATRTQMWTKHLVMT